MLTELTPRCRIDSLNAYYDFRATVDVLRLDLMHPVISGNKWFKLRLYLKEAVVQKKILLTFGGAYSNHIVATAAAARSAGLKSIGIIRGERPSSLSPTLEQALVFGMTLFFVPRSVYREKKIPSEVYALYSPPDLYEVPEGGYGEKGAQGAATILEENNSAAYSHIITAAGTGTTLAGLVLAARSTQKLTGISVLKNNFSLKNEINHLLPGEKKDIFDLVGDYHFGGYARHTPALIRFMNEFYQRSGISTDFVYTAKAFYGIFDLMQKGRFSSEDRLLLIHTGGLQGNRSLTKGTLIF
jgi:1-aminocyclopropane-1-carboxylate deaminase